MSHAEEMKPWKRLTLAGLVGVLASVLAAVALQVVIPVEGTPPPEVGARIRAEDIADVARIGPRLAIRLVPLSMLISWVAWWLAPTREESAAVGVAVGGRRILVAKMTTWLSACTAVVFASTISATLMVSYESRHGTLGFTRDMGFLAFTFGLPLLSGLGVGLSERRSRLRAVNVALLGTWGLFVVAVAMFLMHV